MKKEKIFFVVIVSLIFFVSVVSAVEISMKSSYKQSETMIVKINGNFVSSLTKNNIFFYRNNNVAIPIDKEITNIDGDYYMYAVLPSDVRDYVLSIEKAEYLTSSGQSSNEKITRNFTVGNGSADFTINPGFMVTSKDFDIRLKNNLESSININLGFNGNSQSYSLKIGETKTVTISIANINEAKTIMLTASSGGTSYSIPVQVSPNTTIISAGKSVLKFSQSDLEKEIKVNQTQRIIIYLNNIGEENITNIRLSFPRDFEEIMNVTPKYIKEMVGNSQERITFNFFSNKTKNYDGYLNVTSDDENTSLLMNIRFVSELTAIENGTDTSKNCYELGGTTCYSSETCDGERKILDDGTACCLGNCKSASECPLGQTKCSDGTCKADCGTSSGFPWKTIIGWILVIGVIGFLAWFFYFKNRKPKVNALKEEVRKIEKK